MDMNYTVITDKSLSEAVSALKHTLSNHNFGVLHELNFKETLQSKGVSFDGEFHLLEVCNPQQAKEVLNQHLEVGFLLPCKIGVYKKDGQTYIGMPFLTKLMGMAGNGDLLEVAQEVEDILIAAINEAK